jgi:hypothetical protein
MFPPFSRSKTTGQGAKLSASPFQGEQGESNPRPLAPEARIIPLDHVPEQDDIHKNFGVYDQDKTFWTLGCFLFRHFKGIHTFNSTICGRVRCMSAKASLKKRAKNRKEGDARAWTRTCSQPSSRTVPLQGFIPPMTLC